jgi:DNA-binding CsgD family transcriptional regulator
MAALPLNVPLFETAPRPTYQEIALKARQLKRLGLNYAAVARRLGVTGKTVAKAIAWVDRESRP